MILSEVNLKNSIKYTENKEFILRNPLVKQQQNTDAGGNVRLSRAVYISKLLSVNGPYLMMLKEKKTLPHKTRTKEGRELKLRNDSKGTCSRFLSSGDVKDWVNRDNARSDWIGRAAGN